MRVEISSHGDDTAKNVSGHERRVRVPRMDGRISVSWGWVHQIDGPPCAWEPVEVMALRTTVVKHRRDLPTDRVSVPTPERRVERRAATRSPWCSSSSVADPGPPPTGPYTSYILYVPGRASQDFRTSLSISPPHLPTRLHLASVSAPRHRSSSSLGRVHDVSYIPSLIALLSLLVLGLAPRSLLSTPDNISTAKHL
nr:hypothetical protein CFP56_00983 [Quercus suber]